METFVSILSINSSGQVDKYTKIARERIDLARALVKASEKAANPKPKAKPKAKAGAKGTSKEGSEAASA